MNLNNLHKKFLQKLINKTFLIKLIAILAIIVLSMMIYRTYSDPKFYEKITKEPQLLTMIAFVTITSLVILIIPNFLGRNFTDNNSTSIYIGDLENLSEMNALNEIKLKETPPTPYTLLISTLEPLEFNIQQHIGKLQRNSIVNLMIGIISTFISITVLAFKLINVGSYASMEDFLLDFLPKLSFVIFIQLFAFFFLRLYKGNLEDTKYFQNELTNIMAKTVALRIAYQQEDKPLINKLVRDLSKVERNFKLSAGESLLNIEKSKIEKEFDIEILNTFKDLIKSQKKD
ncbi:hypothetical protein [Pedobacter gandavensis]|uniref:Uncharacterized protein n=1 Tax=Pedobacter gandavensis TaxID=2679963 RepID=A0ABR6EUE8_9SPHI|nr:hypothetical protein [Pedobacter gandavensis]MBB2148822.1 hypothetical protein [Pedobacter gandavensis]